MQSLTADLRYAVRQMINNPGFVLTVLISLALGIGATTAVFSIIHAALVNPYPYPHAVDVSRVHKSAALGAERAEIGRLSPSLGIYSEAAQDPRVVQ